ncbi:MAG: hypothetical protein K0S33_310 [Bacteroidetes bacterium]|jgi:hypothetical protein|nr:hypothetical protein [Bacteroidota bacterium]
MIQKIIPSSGSFAKVLGIFALTLGSYNLQAGDGNGSSLKPEQIIRENIQFPKLSQPMGQNEKVNIVFTTDESGHVNYCLAKTPNAELKKAVEEQFRKFKLVDTQANTAYTIVINFKTL